MKKNIAGLILYICLAYPVYGSQVPLSSGFNYALQMYNPAYAGQKGQMEAAFFFGHGGVGRAQTEGFRVRELSVNELVQTMSGRYNPQYFNYAVSVPLNIEKGRRIAIGLAYSRNDLNLIEASETGIFSFSYNMPLRKGRLAAGMNVKTNIFSASSQRIYEAHDPAQQVRFDNYKQRKMNMDIGLMYSAQSGHFDAGIAIMNTEQQTFEANSINNVYRMSYTIIPQLMANCNHQVRLGKKVDLKSSGIVITNQYLKYTNYLVRSGLWYKTIGISAQYYHKIHPAAGPVISFSNKTVDCFYSYLIDIQYYKIITGFHEAGLRVKL